jgi:hypothetical protein
MYFQELVPRVPDTNVMPSLLMQVLSLVGAVLVLVGFGGQQFASLKSDGLAYGVLNLVGSGLLASSAVVPLNAGVLLLETAWVLLSLNVVVRALRRPRGGVD